MHTKQCCIILSVSKEAKHKAELNCAIARIEEDCCGAIRTQELLDLCVKRLVEMASVDLYALCCLLGDCALFDPGKLCREAAKARKCNTPDLGYERLDPSGDDPAEWDVWLPIKQTEDGNVKSYKLDHWFYLQAPYAEDLEANYRKYAAPD